jgi:hypothetical protein
MSGGWEELLAEAAERLSEQEERDIGEAGDQIEFSDDSPHFMGRWRGIGQLETKRGPVDVYLLWDTIGERRFAFQHSQLVREIEEADPKIGDEVLILRGAPRSFEKDGEQRTVYPYAVRSRPCFEPLPGGGVPGDDDIPF